MSVSKLIFRPFFLLVFAMFVFIQGTTAQIGINTDIPEGILDITSTDSGVLLPRIALTSLTTAAPVINPNGGVLVDGTMVWNTGLAGVTPAGYYYWQGAQWNQVVSKPAAQPQVFFGKLLITASGVINVTSVPFQPTSIEFTAVNRVLGFDNGANNSDSDNSNDIRLAGGRSTGYAQNVGGTISQQTISNAYSGSSLNNIGTYSSDSHCFAAFFVNNNGDPIHDNGTAAGGTDTQGGLISATFTSFDPTGFTINVDNFLAGALSGTTTITDRTNQIVVIYKAYR